MNVPSRSKKNSFWAKGQGTGANFLQIPETVQGAGGVTAQRTQQNNEIYGAHIPTTKGYDNQRKFIPPSKNGANGSLTNQKGEIIQFWVTDVQAEFGITGSVAQSRRKRQFFPHHINQPKIIVKGITQSSAEYNQLAKFIRVAQVYALSERSFALNGITTNKIVTSTSGRPSQTFYDPTIKLYIKGGGTDTKRNHKGSHPDWVLTGFAKNIQAGAERHVYAQEFQFEFISLTAQGGAMWSDTLANYRQIASWMQIFKSRHQGWYDTKSEHVGVVVAPGPNGENRPT